MTGAQPKPPRAKWKMRLFAAFVGVFVALLAGEAAVRMFGKRGYVTPAIQKARVLAYEPAVFSSQVFAQKDVVSSAWAREGFYHVNAKGCRGRDFSAEKPAGTVRVMVYGGSSAFDLDAPEGEDWPSRVEALLRAHGHPEVEVVNAAVPGTTAADSFGRFFAEGHLYRPDYVVLYDAWNDLKSFATETPYLRLFKPLREDADPRLNYRGFVDEMLCNVSQLYVRARDRYYTWKLGTELEHGGPPTPPASKLSTAGPRQYELTLRSFCHLARDVGAIPVLSTEARLVARDNTPAERAKINYAVPKLTHEALCDAFDVADRLTKDVGRELDAVVVDPAGQMRGHPEFFVDHVHTTPAGSAEIARVVAAGIEASLARRK